MKQVKSIKGVDSAFFAIMRFSLKDDTHFFIKKKPFLENGLESQIIFIFYFKMENKIRKKNPKCDS